jgi:hypothetical protein
MAGDGGRVPDVSEQREAPEFDEQAITDILVGIDEVLESHGRERMDIIDGPTVDALRDVVKRELVVFLFRSDPASVLAALLAESPEATVAAIEALLTSDEAGLVAAEMAILDRYGGSPRVLAKHAIAAYLPAACRSLLSKAPKEDGDA